MLDRLLAQRFVVAQLVEVVEVTAGRKGPARTGDHRRPRVDILVERFPDLGQPDVQRIVDRIELIRAIERDDAQAAIGLDVDFIWHVVHFSALFFARALITPQSENPLKR